MWLSQYAPKGVKSLCITSSQTLYVRKPDLVSCKTQERLGGRPICEIYLNTYFQRARLGGRLICEIGLYASIYGIACMAICCKRLGSKVTQNMLSAISDILSHVFLPPIIMTLFTPVDPVWSILVWSFLDVYCPHECDVKSMIHVSLNALSTPVWSLANPPSKTSLSSVKDKVQNARACGWDWAVWIWFNVREFILSWKISLKLYFTTNSCWTELQIMAGIDMQRKVHK